MEQTSTLSVAKVIIEYHDPSGVFQYINKPLEDLLPLRNLHWKSPRRPLRSIDSLHVDLKNNTGDTPSGNDGSRPGSQHSQIVATAPVKERRHQIPGLRQTPYLKLFLLRCDDVETYKATQRKALREWIKTHIPASQSSSSKKNAQENHDAFEWMILHVVLPNTNAATEQSVSKPAARTDTSEKSSKFLNRGSTSLLEKIKSDFNISSKSAPDRVAQLHLSNDQVRNATQNQSETQDQKEAWDDTISKVKALILASFDLRVSQYEEDLKERESQRSLPGWNFCTFFVLKEGLAQGFESVGLVDDALALYEGLELELDAVLARKDGSGHTDLFLEYTAQVKSLFEKAKTSSGATPLTDVSNLLISSTKKNFRELILANKISVFDFKTYVLARKMAVLLRMSRASKETENLIPLGQLCQLASFEIPILARLLREDLKRISGDSDEEADQPIIENIVASWIYTVCQQILDETRSAFLSGSTPSELQFTSLFKEKTSPYPSRRNSLNPQSALEKSTDDAQVLFETLKSRASSAPETQQKSGKDFLAMQRSMLVTMQRRILESLAPKQRFLVGWPIEGQDMKDISLEDEEYEEEDERFNDRQQTVNKEALSGIFDQALINAVSSLSSLRSTYEKLTEDAMDLYFIAGQGKNFERMLADLAVLKYQSRDYAGAANFFAKIIPVYSQLQWSLLERQMLIMHAQCLKLLNRRDDYVRMLLGILAKAVSEQLSFKNKRSAIEMENFNVQSQTIKGQSLLVELLSSSSQLPYEISVDLLSYFQNVQVEPYIHHYQEKEGFQMVVKLRSPFHDQFTIDRVILILETTNEIVPRTIQLTNGSANTMSMGMSSIVVSCNTTTFGFFHLKKLQLTCSKINFTYEPLDGQNYPMDHKTIPSIKQKVSNIICYPREDAFGVKLSQSRVIHIDQRRYLELECNNGPCLFQNIEIKLKSASSGLRLHIAEATCKAGDLDVSVKSSSTSIAVQRISSHSKLCINIPFELDDAHREIVIKVDVNSKESPMEFTSIETVQVELPLDVNVHDIFKASHIFSRFHIRSALEHPLRIVDLELEGTEDYEIEAPPVVPLPTTIYSKQPESFMYKIHPRHLSGSIIAERKGPKDEKPLTLTVDYHCIDEEAQWIILAKFTADLEQSNYSTLRRLLIKIFQTHLQRLLTSENYSYYTLINEITVPSFDEVGWSNVLADLPSKEYWGLNDWLSEWHGENISILGPDHSTQSETQSSEVTRSIIIYVPLPRLHILQLVDISLPISHTPLAVGEPFLATLKIEHSRHWESPSSFQHATESSQALDFMYSVEAPLDTWAIGGQRRGKFVANAEEMGEWQLILIPLKAGKLLLPSVEVRPSGSEELSCETDFKGAGKTVLVVNNLQRTTVSMIGTDSKLMSAIKVD